MYSTFRPTMVARAVAVAGLVVMSAGQLKTLEAQSRSEPAPVSGSIPGESYTPPRRGFNLFANVDVAASGMRSAGNFYWAVSNIGPCADGHVLYGDGFGCGGYTGSGAGLFEIVLSAGVPSSDYAKIRTAHPGVEAHLGPKGFTQLSSHLRFGAASQDWGPADNSVGRLFSGVRSTSDRTCRDDTERRNNFVQTNVTLLAGSDCPETWSADGFDGPRTISEAAFLTLKSQQGSAFTFDWFRVPRAPRNSTRFLGSFSTYGEISDHFSEALKSYGQVTPKFPDAQPTRNGFPLGLDVRFDAFTFNRPSLANAVFWQMIVVNNSRDVYGVGIDYDSLYMGVMQGISITGDDHSSQYALPHRNGIFWVRNGINTGCNGAVGAPGISSSTCQNNGFRRSHGFGAIMLKSPIGDTRNKLLTRAGPFYDPASPYADDTITFNHHHGCGFGNNCFGSTTALNDRRGFGMISSTEDNVLDGRATSSVTLAQQWATFRPKAHPTAGSLRFNRYVPGTWSYENKSRPAGLTAAERQDTIFFDACEGNGFITLPNQNGGQPLPRCVVAFSDTTAGKLLNSGPSNAGGVMTAGPFRLKAGDTTSFIISWFAARDSLAFEALANAITTEYLRFFPSPESPPTPTIAGAEVLSAQAQRGTGQRPRVRLVFDDQPELATDAYFTQYAADLRTSPDPYLRGLRTLNPDLADSIDRAAPNNLAELLIYRSCDGGVTFDLRISCAARSGAGARTPTPYAVLRATPAGDIPNTFTDTAVLAGVSYLYSMVTRSRGLTVGIIDVDSTDSSAACLADTTYVACRKVGRILTVADTVMGAIATEGPSVVKVYVPISSPAGGEMASARLTTRSGTATVPIQVTLAGRPVSGDYRVIFGNRFLVQQTINTLTNAVTSVVRVQSVIPSATSAGVPLTNFVEREVVLSGAGPLDFTGFAYTPEIATNVSSRVETDTVVGLGFVLAEGNRPLYLSRSVVDTGAAPTTPLSFLRRSDFPGFVLSLNNRSSDTLQFERVILPSGDSIAASDSTSVEYRQQNSTRVSGRGQYTITFADDPFGQGGPFTLDRLVSDGSILAASLAARTTATTGDISPRVRAIVGGASGAALRAIRLPFTVTSATGNQVIVATVSRTLAAPAATAHSYLFGEGADTLRVAVDSLAWLPGDRLILLEVVQNDSLIGGAVVIDAAGKRVTQLDTVVAFDPFILGCDFPRRQCNALTSGSGSSGYQPYAAGTRLVINYPIPFTALSAVDIRVSGPVALASLTRASLNGIRVVPNPYVLSSQYEVAGAAGRGEPRIMFSGVPARGTIRIYSLSGQLLRQITWAPSDIEGGDSGDLPWNLRTRSGELIASGLYVYVITAHDERGKQVNARGKFVVIR